MSCDSRALALQAIVLPPDGGYAGYQNLDVGNVTTQSVSGLTASTFYYYRLCAYKGTGTSPNSNVVTVKTKNH
jgi:hypothetical protein